ncbi:MAG TPA: helix-turn-helix transcriptional regulator [Thermoanaerobaculia bacterium]|nr:helix-turn-helix transcriptional regulator [Thermoanaerobaculia bacterium]
MSAPDPDAYLPLKPAVFHILLALLDGERHGWALLRELEAHPDAGRVLPGNLYRTLRDLARAGLIEETQQRPDPELDDQRRRYFAVTGHGRSVAAAEARRLERMVAAARARRLLGGRQA